MSTKAEVADIPDDILPEPPRAAEPKKEPAINQLVTDTNDLVARHVGLPDALTSGFHRALLACSIFLVAAAVIAAAVGRTRRLRIETVTRYFTGEPPTAFFIPHQQMARILDGTLS